MELKEHWEHVFNTKKIEIMEKQAAKDGLRWFARIVPVLRWMQMQVVRL